VDRSKHKSFLRNPVKPIGVDKRSNVGDLLERMGATAFQGKNLSIAARIWSDMLRKRVTIFLGLAGAMVPAGMRELIAYLIENRLIDCLVSTGANLFHDCHETVGKFHYQGSHQADDMLLKEQGIDRIYDVFARDSEFQETDRFIADCGVSVGGRDLSTREFLYLLGKRLSRVAKKKGILTSAYKAKVPIYCPAVSDSSIGIALAVAAARGAVIPRLDVIADVNESADIVAGARTTGVIYIAGGTPKNFIQQTEVTAALLGHEVEGHSYAIQFSVDPPHWGGLSGCTFEEAQSWGKVSKKARKTTVYCDATIALPMVVHALVQQSGDVIASRKAPDMRLAWPES
jgi:deoxyhypusine synthase